MRVSSGNAELDTMCGGGIFRDSIILVSGATGTGKTLLVTEFIAGGVADGERCLLFGFEESRDQLFRNARGWGSTSRRWSNRGCSRSWRSYPEIASLEDHLHRHQGGGRRLRAAADRGRQPVGARAGRDREGSASSSSR